MSPTLLTVASCAVFVVSLLAAAVCDLRERRIPNRLVLVLVLAAPLFHFSALSGPGSLFVSALPALAVLGAGLLQFRMGWIGAGDVKLAAASALWLDPAGTALFLVRTALVGAVLALPFWLARWDLPALATGRRPERTDPRSVSLPYGVAIAAGALLTFATVRLGWL